MSLTRSWRLAMLGVVFLAAAAAIWFLSPLRDSEAVRYSESVGVAVLLVADVLIALAGLSLLLLGTPPFRIVTGRPSRIQLLTLVIAGLGFSAIIYRRVSRVPEIHLRVIAPFYTEDRSVVYVVPSPSWADSVAVVCADWSARDSALALDSLRSRRGRDARLDAFDVAAYLDRYDYLNRRLAPLAAVLAWDSAAVTLAGYVDGIRLRRDGVLIAVTSSRGRQYIRRLPLFRKDVGVLQEVRPEAVDCPDRP